MIERKFDDYILTLFVLYIIFFATFISENLPN